MKAIEKRINEINELIAQVNELELSAYTYGGGTFPHIVNIKPIRVKNQFVTIETASPSRYDFISKERYNMNKLAIWDTNGMSDLKYTLTHIKKALTQSLKNQ